jgi:hypothetical protein
MPVLRPNAEHAAKTPFEGPVNTEIPAIMACVYTAHSKIGFDLYVFPHPAKIASACIGVLSARRIPLVWRIL